LLVNDRRLPSAETTRGHSDALVFFGATGDLAYKKIRHLSESG
jgi:hypothetical protein